MTNKRENLIITYLMDQWIDNTAVNNVDILDLYKYLETENPNIPICHAIKNFNEDLYLSDLRQDYSLISVTEFFKILNSEIASLNNLCKEYQNL